MRSGTTAAAPRGQAGWRHSLRRPERREQRTVLGQRLVDRADRLIARRVMVRACADECEHVLSVGHGDRAVAELLEELVGDRARRALGQAAPKLRQRRLQELEHRRLAPRPAHAGHDRIVHITEEILARAARPLRRARGLEWTGAITEREHRIATYNPVADARRDALHPRSRRAPRAHPQAAVRRRSLAAAGRRDQARRGLLGRRVREALEETGLRVELDALPRRGERDASSSPVETSRGARMSSRPGRRTRGSRRRTPTRSPARGGERSPSSPARCGIACSRPATPSGATASRCTTRRSRTTQLRRS